MTETWFDRLHALALSMDKFYEARKAMLSEAAKVNCYRCGGPIGEVAHAAASHLPGGDPDWACDPCYRKLMDAFVGKRPTALPPCEGCGAGFGEGCSCRENSRAIGRGERREP